MPNDLKCKFKKIVWNYFQNILFTSGKYVSHNKVGINSLASTKKIQ